jgi:GH24 family phage-related lysozyme (muramidase)
MKASKNAVELIKKFEGVRYKSYKASPNEDMYTIGYGHYGVLKAMTITPEKAEQYLIKDMAKAEKEVDKYMAKYHFNQNEYDALVSFVYNVGSLKGLTANGTRTIQQVGQAMLLYTKCKGKLMKGLVDRRIAENRLYRTPLVN